MRKEKPEVKGSGLRKAWAMLMAALSVVHFSILASCTSIDCPVQNTVYTVYNLMKADGTADTMGVDTLWVWTPRADGTDTLLLNRLCGQTATAFSLPISYTQPEDTLCTLLADTTGRFWLDTLFVKKENTPHFESVDCQASYFHTITDVRTTHHAVDSLVIHQPQVNYDASKAHLYLYLKARR